MENLKTLCHRSYPILNTGIPILQQMYTSTKLHNKHRLKYFPKERNTFDGKDNCGAACYILNYLLGKHHFPTTMTTSSKGSFSKLTDHTYLYHNYHIIDPTYRQMFLPDSETIASVDGKDPYYEYLFNQLPYVFIGTFEELTSLSHTLHRLHKEVYDGKELEHKLDMWQDGIDNSRKSDCNKIIKDVSYAYEKGRPFFKLRQYLITQEQI